MKTFSGVGFFVGLVIVALIGAPQASATTVFSTGFEYAGGEPNVGTDAANLNGSDGQIGSFSGALPGGAGGEFEPELMGFGDHPDNASRLLWVDRPTESSSFFADLASAIFLDGGRFSFEVGTRRTNNGNHNKDYDVVGLDRDGLESFRLRISTAGTLADESERLGVVTDSGATVTYDLTTVAGNDADQDLDNLGAPPFDAGEIGAVTLSLGSSSYAIDFVSGLNAYTTETISYNGSATELSRIEFTFPGGEANGVRAGYVLDNLNVEGVVVPEPCTLIMAVVGFASLCLVSRRRSRR